MVPLITKKTSKWGAVRGEGPCTACKAPLIWVLTKNKKMMPVNDDGSDVSHYATCSDPERFRRRDRRKDPR